MGALFQSRGWLPIVEAPGYFRHPTSILAMQLLKVARLDFLGVIPQLSFLWIIIICFLLIIGISGSLCYSQSRKCTSSRNLGFGKICRWGQNIYTVAIFCYDKQRMFKLLWNLLTASVIQGWHYGDMYNELFTGASVWEWRGKLLCVELTIRDPLNLVNHRLWDAYKILLLWLFIIFIFTIINYYC